MLYKSDQICVSSTTALQAGSPMWGVASHPCNLHEIHHGSKAVFWRQEYTIIHQSDMRKQCDVVWACFQGSLMVAPLKQSPIDGCTFSSIRLSVASSTDRSHQCNVFDQMKLVKMYQHPSCACPTYPLCPCCPLQHPNLQWCQLFVVGVSFVHQSWSWCLHLPAPASDTYFAALMKQTLGFQNIIGL